MIAVELAKQLPRPRTWLTFAALAAFTVVLTLSLVAAGAGRQEAVGDLPLLIRPDLSGFSVPVIALASTMKFFLPLAVSIFAGEAVSGEATWGSLRYTLARGIPRSRLLGSKAAVAAILSLTAVALVPLAGLLVGTVAFGWHPLPVVDGSAPGFQQTAAMIDPAGALGRLCVATAYVAAGMTSIFAFAFFLSTVSGRPVVAVAGGVGLTVLSRVLNADYLPGVAVLSPYMPNNDVDRWMQLFLQPPQAGGMLSFLVLQAVYSIVFGGLAWWWFAHRDIAS